MALNLRSLGVGIAIVGVAVGVAFGSGIAYGRGDPKTVEGGLTQQQIQSLLGISGAQATGGTGAAGATTGAPDATGAPRQGAGGTGAAALSRNPTGRVVSIAGNVITIETAQGQSKVNITPTTTITRSSTAVLADIKEGMTIVAGGTRNADGSFDASSLSQVPTELQTLVTAGAGTGGGAGAGAGTTPATTPAR